MRRILYLWLQHWPIDRWRRTASRQPKNSVVPVEGVPFATVVDLAGRRLLAAVDTAAAAKGLAPGMPLADALSFFPGLAITPAQPAEDARALRRLADWCVRYSPWTAPDGIDGVKIEITGCAHLWGGEEKLAADLVARLGRQGIACRIAVADTLGAAWALARFAAKGAPAILPSAELRDGLAPLPIEALRLDPVTTLGLRRLGLQRVADLWVMPRDALTRRFDEQVTRRLDQALGLLPEPLSPMDEPPVRRVRLSFAEPIVDAADLGRAAERLAADLASRLVRQGVGARRLDLAFHRLDGRVEHIVLGTARPSHDPHHIASLFAERLDGIDPGPGIEDAILAAFAVEPRPPDQIGFAGTGEDERSGGLAQLFDRLGNRLGLTALSRIEARESHIPERASVRIPVDNLAPVGNGMRHGGAERSSENCAATTARPGRDMSRLRRDALAMRKSIQDSPYPEPYAQRPSRRTQCGDAARLTFLVQPQASKPPRPIRLFEPPQPIAAYWLLPDDPPFRFTWRHRAHRVSRADGPERIAEEWWRAARCEGGSTVRDYYRVEDEDGRRFWLFRAGLPGSGPAPRWYVHGVFA
jgi:protein ImuB